MSPIGPIRGRAPGVEHLYLGLDSALPGSFSHRVTLGSDGVRRAINAVGLKRITEK